MLYNCKPLLSHQISKSNQDKQSKEVVIENKAKKQAARHVEQVPTALFFAHNTQLGPPYHVLIDTNFINFSIKNKLEIYKSMMDCLLAKCIPCITDCVMAELEKLGSKYRLALRLAKDPRVEGCPAHTPGHMRMTACFTAASSTGVISWRPVTRSSKGRFGR